MGSDKVRKYADKERTPAAEDRSGWRLRAEEFVLRWTYVGGSLS